MYKILVVEDVQFQAQLLADIISKKLPNATINIVNNYHDAIGLLEKYTYNLFFLDIILSENDPSLNGIKIADIIRSMPKYNYTPIIFVTICKDEIAYAVNQIHCHSYISKPFETKEINTAIDNVLNSPAMQNTQMNLKDNNGVRFSIRSNELLYVYSKGHLLYLTTFNNTYTLSHKPLDYITANLGTNFVKCHRNYLVNLHNISNYDKTMNTIKIADTTIPVGRNYKTFFETMYISSEQ